MSKIFLCGHTNIETTLQVDQFPIEYTPVHYTFDRVASTISGVGINIATALKALGDDLDFCTVIGDDIHQHAVKAYFKNQNLSDKFLFQLASETSQSVILYDPSGKRQINVDLKNLQTLQLPQETITPSLLDADLAILCNINYSRPMLSIAKDHHIPIAVDCHTIGSLEDEFNQDYMQAADILFMSDEHIPLSRKEWMVAVMQRFAPKIFILGCGKDGSLMILRDDDAIYHTNAFAPRLILNTIGAGDALFSSFVHFYLLLENPLAAIQRASLYAGYKIGERSASQGLLSSEAFEQLFQTHHQEIKVCKYE